jgi:hypothetical protein
MGLHAVHRTSTKDRFNEQPAWDVTGETDGLLPGIFMQFPVLLLNIAILGNCLAEMYSADMNRLEIPLLAINMAG